MQAALSWMEAHEALSGWAQFLGAILALIVTYLTAFAPVWRRKRQLHGSALRLLGHGYEVIESYHRTSAHFAPFPRSLKQAALTMAAVANEISKFPVFDLDEQFGAMSLPRRLMTMGMLLETVKLDLDAAAEELDGVTGSSEDHEALRAMLEQRLAGLAIS